MYKKIERAIMTSTPQLDEASRSSTFVSEIYATIQGEGPYTGERQIFVRLAGCPLRCNYCDTPGSLTAQGHPQRTAADVLESVLKMKSAEGINTVSVTGGEPLAHTVFLQALLPRLKQNGCRVYLETAGAHPKPLSQIVEWCDVISMDMKLPSATRHVFWDEHREFLTIAGSKAFVKVVLEKRSLEKEIEQVVSILSEKAHPPLLVLQPASPQSPDIEPPPAEVIGRFFQLATSKLPHVFIMPQQHKIWGIR